MKKIFTILICSVFLGAAGCGQTGGSKNSAISLNSSKWIFKGIRNSEANILEPVPESIKGMNAVFTKPDQFGAASSCNTFYGTYKTSGSNSLKIDNLTMTKMFCPDDPVMKWESIYFDGFKNSEMFSFKGDTLIIATTDKKLMIFKAE